MVSITFLGAAGTVTGSKYLVEHGKVRLLIDAGMFQGERSWRERNWEQVPFSPEQISAVLLTHAHIDHTGMLPRFVSRGVAAPIYATTSTVALSELLLKDSAHLQAEEAEYRGRTGRSRHHPPLPLYSPEDVVQTIKQMRAVAFHRRIEVAPQVFATWYRAGHILGAASIALEIGGKRIMFSGDIGRYGVPILRDPEPVPLGDLLLVESTYGDKEHEDRDPKAHLAAIVSRTAARGGVTVIPSFAVGRCQQLLYDLRVLKEQRLIPDIPVVVDSPMASDVTKLYGKAVEEFDDEALGIVARGAHPFTMPKLGFTRDREQSKKLNDVAEPMVLIAASGMLTGGRILHHLKHRIGDPRNTIIFVGHQPEGGRGWWIKSGAPTVRLFGSETPIRAEIAEISALSAHGDRSDLLHWCNAAKNVAGAPGKVAVVHGEPATAKVFAERLHSEFGWNASPPGYQDRWEV